MRVLVKEVESVLDGGESVLRHGGSDKLNELHVVHLTISIFVIDVVNFSELLRGQENTAGGCEFSKANFVHHSCVVGIKLADQALDLVKIIKL